ncbi:unnamed protein product [Paramecium octaurelia]|uniref:Uncharacterized protein n=1 Tax=Paramecium octaurelia TaxID=43137 RepID=A0A8S1SXT3_PAROT|nr:unnamed protein product [Paramecium octaurelia]
MMEKLDWLIGQANIKTKMEFQIGFIAQISRIAAKNEYNYKQTYGPLVLCFFEMIIGIHSYIPWKLKSQKYLKDYTLMFKHRLLIDAIRNLLAYKPAYRCNIQQIKIHSVLHSTMDSQQLEIEHTMTFLYFLNQPEFGDNSFHAQKWDITPDKRKQARPKLKQRNQKQSHRFIFYQNIKYLVIYRNLIKILYFHQKKHNQYTTLIFIKRSRKDSISITSMQFFDSAANNLFYYASVTIRIQVNTNLYLICFFLIEMQKLLLSYVQIQKQSNRNSIIFQKKNMSCEIEQEEDLYGILALVKDVDEVFFPIITKILKRKKIQDCLEFLQSDQCFVTIEKLKLENLSLTDKEFIVEKKDIRRIIDVLKKIMVHQFNKQNYPIDEEKNQERFDHKNIK